MPRTRGDARSGADAERDTTCSQDQEKQPRDIASGGQNPESPTQSAGQKRKVTSENEASAKQRRTSERQGAATSVRAEKKEEQPKEEDLKQRKPRLTTPDLEYDCDRSKLRDQDQLRAAGHARAGMTSVRPKRSKIGSAKVSTYPSPRSLLDV